MMKNKILCSSIVSIFAIIFLMSAVSAVSLNGISLVSSPSSVSNNAGSFNIIFNLTNDGAAGNLYYNLSNFTSSQSGLTLSFNDSYIAVGTTETITATVSFTNGQTGTIAGNINVGNTADATDETLAFSVLLTTPTTTVPDEISECSATGNPNSDLRIKIDDVNVNGYGKDEEWLPLDEISVDIKVENKNTNDKIDNIVVGWGVYNKDTDEWYVDDEENDFDLKKKDDKTLTVTFKLDESIDELADGDYTLYVWANGALNDADICASDSKAIDMIIESDFVILNNIKFTSPVECGTEMQITGDVWNIGDDDQEGVVVVIQNTELGITNKANIGDVNSFDKEKLNALIQIPQNAKEKQYDFEFMVYDEDGGIYVNDYDDDESSVLLPLKVEGGCAVQSTAAVSASLESGGKAGSELKIKATITNTGTKPVNYTLNAVDYSAWATLVGIEPQTLTLNAGESKEALLTFNVAKDVSGDKLFNLEILSGTSLVTKQPVSVPIESAGLGISGISLGNNWYLWLIGALNVILVVVIIIIAVRVAKK